MKDINNSINKINSKKAEIKLYKTKTIPHSEEKSLSGIGVVNSERYKKNEYQKDYESFNDKNTKNKSIKNYFDSLCLGKDKNFNTLEYESKNNYKELLSEENE